MVENEKILVRPVELAKLLDVNRTKITRATKINGPLDNAVEGGKINLNDQSVKDFFKSEGVEFPTPEEMRKKLNRASRTGRKMDRSKTGSAKKDEPIKLTLDEPKEQAPKKKRGRPKKVNEPVEVEEVKPKKKTKKQAVKEFEKIDVGQV